MGLFSKIGSLFQSNVAPATPLDHAFDQIASLLPQIAALPGSHERLLPGIEHALAYYADVVARIPGPVPISATSHHGNPVLGALFRSPDEVTQGLGKSLAVRNSLQWFVENSHEQVVAIMGMRRREVAPGQALFVDHTIRSLGTDAADARKSLCEAAIASLLKAFAAESTERLRRWRLHEGNPAGGAPAEEPTPQREMQALAQWLAAPGDHLRLDGSDSHTLPSREASTGLSMPLLASSDRRKWLVCLVQFPLQEALSAVAQESQGHRYILI